MLTQFQGITDQAETQMEKVSMIVLEFWDNRAFWQLSCTHVQLKNSKWQLRLFIIKQPKTVELLWPSAHKRFFAAAAVRMKRSVLNLTFKTERFIGAATAAVSPLRQKKNR